MLSHKKLPAFTGVPASLASGGVTTVTCSLPTGIRLHTAILEFGNDGATNPGQGIGTLALPGMVQECRVIIDGKVQRRFTGQELNFLNARNGAQYAATTSGAAGAAGYRTYLPIFFAEPWRRYSLNDPTTNQPIPEAEASAWNLVGIRACTIEVDLIGRTSVGVGGILDGPVITGIYEWDAPIQNGLGTIVKYKRQNFGVNASPAEIATLDRTTGDYQAITIFPTVEATPRYVTQLKLTRNNELVRDDITRFENDTVLKTRGLNPPALDTTSAATRSNTGAYNFVADYNDPMRNLMQVSGATELTLKPTFDAAPNGNLIVISEIVGLAD